MTLRTIPLNLALTILLLPLAVGAFGSGWDNEYDGQPWVKNASRPYDISRGMEGRHISLWASHGRYYKHATHKWEWQRPALFGTREDLFTQTIVSTYLIPMLENAGAVVFTPRERDMQAHEVIVDNDAPTSLVSYSETMGRNPWTTSHNPGFAPRKGPFYDGENPFEQGTTRVAQSVKSHQRQSTAVYQPLFPQTGDYAVYVSYPQMQQGVPDARYTVWHQGQPTEIHVNQQMGGGTWVYVGTFRFDAGTSQANRVVVSNYSHHDGYVGTDAVRFGGGMGNIARGDGDGGVPQEAGGATTSHLPRYLEGSRYWAQWAGMPYDIYSSKGGVDDYADDINARSLMTNYLGGGSTYMPGDIGLRVPIEMCVAIHSDAGYHPDGKTTYGPISICTTPQGLGKKSQYSVDSHYAGGPSRSDSYRLAEDLLACEEREMQKWCKDWIARGVKDKNYSETRLPAVPSVILETMSHQSFPDMRFGQDPNFRFHLARSIYKTLLRHSATMHHQKEIVVQPLAPHSFAAVLNKKGDEAMLTWMPTTDPLEPTAMPRGYVLYTAVGNGGFDNGHYIPNGHTFHKALIAEGQLYRFRLTAVNDGGESFPTTTLAVCHRSGAKQTVMVVDGFNRLSSPAVIDDSLSQGFDLDTDAGVTLGPTLGWAGRQTHFERTAIGRVDTAGLGATDASLAGQLVAGNDQRHLVEHAEAIREAMACNIVSAEAEAVANGSVSLENISAIDLVLGLQQDDGHSLLYYKTFSPELQQQLRQFTRLNGAVLASGAYLGSDMQSEDDRQFLSDVLHCRFATTNRSDDEGIKGLGLNTSIYRKINGHHYFAQRCDVLEAASARAFPIMTYPNGNSAAVAYSHKGQNTVAVGFPLECVKDERQRKSIIGTLVKYILK